MGAPGLQSQGGNSGWRLGSQREDVGVELSIISVNWNSRDFLRDCIISICETVKHLSYEMIVVDNASSEGGLDKLVQEFPGLKLVRSSKNLGFAGANNLGYEHARGDYILFLNPDTQVLGSAIQTMVSHLRSLADCGVIGCKLLNTDGSVQTSCIQTFPTIMNQLFDLELLRRVVPNLRMWGIAPLLKNSQKPVKVEVVSGACMMLKREVFRDVGLFSKEYFMYAEDLDLCYKTRQRGMSNYYISDAVVVHHGQKSSSKQGDALHNSEWAIVMRCDSVLKYCSKTKGRAYASMYRMAMAASALFRVLILAAPAALSGTAPGKSAHPKVTLAKWSSVLAWSLGLHRRPDVFRT